jgi:hypothetical protein
MIHAPEDQFMQEVYCLPKLFNPKFLGSFPLSLVIETTDQWTGIAVCKGNDCAINLHAKAIAAIVDFLGLSSTIYGDNGSVFPIIFGTAIQGCLTNATPLNIATNCCLGRRT